MKRAALFLLSGLILGTGLRAQDPDPFFTTRIPLLLDPSRSGADAGVQVGMGNMVQRAQLTGAFRTQMLAASYGFRKRERSRAWIGLGLTVSNDRASGSGSKTTSVGISPATHVRTSKRSFLSVGLGAHWVNRNFSLEDGEWASQYNGRYYDPNIDSGESWNNTTNAAIDFRIGGSWTMKAHGSARENATHDVLVLGAAIDHLAPISLGSDGGELAAAEQRRTAYAIVEFPVGFVKKGFMSLDGAVHQQAGTSTGRVNLMVGRRIIRAKRISDNSSPIGFKAGLGYRYNEALLVNASIDWWMLSFGMAYGTSITNSAQQIAGRRTSEVFLQFRTGR